MKKNEQQALEWLTREGFDENGYTYIYYGQDSYNIREDLKKNNFRFNSSLMWHCPNKDNFYAAKCFPVHYTTVLQLMTYGKGFYFEETAKKIKDKIASFNPKPKSTSEYIEPEEGKIDVFAVCTGHRIVESMYGTSNLYTFVSDGNEITWFTTSDPGIEVGDEGELIASFKKHSEYNGVKTTQVTRAKLK